MNDLRRAIVICTEPHFEWKSRLLVRSVRAFGGCLSSIRIVSYSPRPGYAPSRECQDEFRALGVEIITSPLNVVWAEYSLANKVLACAHAEKFLDLDKIAFFDSDQIVLSSFESLFENDASFAARPVDFKNIGVVGSDDCEGEYWSALYRICGVERKRTIKTTVCESVIWEYFDSGMFSVDARAGMLQAWKSNFELVWFTGVRPKAGDYFVEQSCLSATVSAMADETFVLPPGYNLPIDEWYRAARTESHCRTMQTDAVSLHYHRLFDERPLDDILRFGATIIGSEHWSWLQQNVEELVPSTCDVSQIEPCGNTVFPSIFSKIKVNRWILL